MSRLVIRIIMGIILLAVLAGAVAWYLQRDNGKIVAYSTAPVTRGDLLVSIYAIGILLGLPPAELVPELSPASSIPSAPPAVPVGLPSDVLRRRPDIRRAEADIHAATARIGVATAELFPKFTITGALGVRSGDFSSWLTWAQRFWSFGPAASWRVFDTGATRAAIEQQQALQEQTLIAYQQTLLSALQEVENALIASAKEQERRAALVDAVAANRKAVNLSKTLYTEGQMDFLSVLDAQRSLFAAEETLARSTSAVSTDLVALHKAIGGGWNGESGDVSGSTPDF